MTENINKKIPLIIEDSDEENKLTSNTSSILSDASPQASSSESSELSIDDNSLETEFEKINCNDENYYSN